MRISDWSSDVCSSDLAAGMNPQETGFLIDIFSKINQNGVTIFVIEHNMNLIMRIADRITVVNFGKRIAVGNPEEIRNNSDVTAAYLGGEGDRKSTRLNSSH